MDCQHPRAPFLLAIRSFQQSLLLCGWGWTLFVTVVDAQPVGRRLSHVAGPFHAVVERFEQCPIGPNAEPWSGDETEASGEAADAFIVNVTRVSREWGPRAQAQRITGNLTVNQILDDSSSTLLTIDKWSNNQWKRNAFIMRLPALCSALRDLGLLAGALCPAQQGVYSFQDLAADWQFASMPQFYYGTWRAEAVFNQDGARRGCVRWLFKTSPAWPEHWPLPLGEDEDDERVM